MRLLLDVLGGPPRGWAVPVLALGLGLLVAVLGPRPAVAQGPVATPRPQAQRPGNLAPHELVDPIDGSHFQVTVVTSSNGLGGYDADGCTYARGLQARGFAIGTSPTTGFTAPLGGFLRSIPKAKKGEVLLLLAAQGTPETLAARPVSERYALAAELAEFLGDSSYVVGELYLQGAWTVRDSIVGFLPGVQGASDAWSKLSEVVSQARQLSDTRARTVALFDLARLAHRGGFVVERDDFLALLDTFEDAGLGAMEKREEFKRRVGVEGRLLEEARRSFLAGLDAGDGVLEEQAHYRYLVAEIGRRRGELAEAENLLEGLLLQGKASPETEVSIRDVAAVLKVQARSKPTGDEASPRPETP